jgi:hypothetical protein
MGITVLPYLLMEQRRDNCGIIADIVQTQKCVYFAEKVHKTFANSSKFYGKIHYHKAQ